jgi:cysteine desulfurase
MSARIYMDYNATTPLAPEVAERMRELLDSPFGNPSSGHWAGTAAKEVIEHGRAQVAALLGAAPEEIVFTSGGSEANNAAIKGVLSRVGRPEAHVITTAVEHPAVLQPCRYLERQGARLTILPVDAFGRIDPEDLRRAMTADTVLVSIMHANNEVGTIQPIAECARIVREHGALLHVDAAQSLGKIPVKVEELGADLLSIAAHKFYGPKGIGALYIRRGVEIDPLIHGAAHERGRRAGTESALLIGGIGQAAALAGDLDSMSEVRALRDRLWRGLQQALGDEVVLNGHPEQRLPNTLNVSFVGREGAELLRRLEGLAASTGSACHAGSVELSPVLRAMGISERVGMGAVRLSLGRYSTAEEVEAVIHRIGSVL